MKMQKKNIILPQLILVYKSEICYVLSKYGNPFHTMCVYTQSTAFNKADCSDWK